MRPIKYRTKAACRIAGVHPDRFNEAVAAKFYPCAPETERGSARVFDETALIALYIYGFLLKQDWTPRQAGKYACFVQGYLTDHFNENDVKEVTVCITEIGDIHTYGNSSEKLLGEQYRELPSGRVVQRLSFDIENIRLRIKDEIEAEEAIRGEDD